MLAGLWGRDLGFSQAEPAVTPCVRSIACDEAAEDGGGRSGSIRASSVPVAARAAAEARGPVADPSAGACACREAGLAGAGTVDAASAAGDPVAPFSAVLPCTCAGAAEGRWGGAAMAPGPYKGGGLVPSVLSRTSSSFCRIAKNALASVSSCASCAPARVHVPSTAPRRSGTEWPVSYGVCSGSGGTSFGRIPGIVVVLFPDASTGSQSPRTPVAASPGATAAGPSGAIAKACAANTPAKAAAPSSLCTTARRPPGRAAPGSGQAMRGLAGATMGIGSPIRGCPQPRRECLPDVYRWHGNIARVRTERTVHDNCLANHGPASASADVR